MPIIVSGDLAFPTQKIADSNPLNSLKKLDGNFDNFCHMSRANFAFLGLASQSDLI
jgi:hypothetical protein